MTLSRFLAASLLACSLGLGGCGDDRAAQHAAEADARLSAGELDQALIEIHSAFRLDPTNAEYAERIADLLMIKGKPAQARFYFGETYRLDPQHFEAAIRLAALQFAEDPEESKQLLEDVIARAPESAWGPIGLSELALYENDSAAALRHAVRAVELEPDNADAHWQQVSAITSQIREATRERVRPPDEIFERAIEALDRFVELDPQRAWHAHAERPRLYMAWHGHRDDVAASLSAASDHLAGLGLVRPEFEMLDAGIEYARAAKDTELEEWALERKIARAPDLYSAWDELARLYSKTDRAASDVYQRLIAMFPDAVEPQIHRARFLREKRGRRLANKKLERAIADGFDAAPLLAEIAKNQVLLGEKRAAKQTIAKLEKRFPDSRESVVMAAWGFLQSGQPSVAIDVLAEHEWTEEDVPAQRVLVDAHSAMGDNPGTIAALEHLMELLPEPDLLARRRYAQALYDNRDYHAARAAYRRLQRDITLSPEEYSRYAVSLYETNAHSIARGMLERAADRADPPQIAILELYAREGSQDRNRERLRRGFAKLLEATPNNPRVLTAYVRFEIEAKTPENAIEAIARSVATARRGKHPLAGVLSLQARVQDAMGDREAARETALEVLDVAPNLIGALEFAQGLYETRAEALAAITKLTSGIKNEDQPAQRHALLGRLYYRADNKVMARWSYEQALTGGLELPLLKNDLAFLLADQKRDLKRAKVLALQAQQALPDEPGVVDTLAYVLLQQGEYQAAIDRLREGLEMAKAKGSPQAEMHYHLGLALAGLERSNEAESAFAAALALGESFPDEAKARKQLATLRGEI